MQDDTTPQLPILTDQPTQPVGTSTAQPAMQPTQPNASVTSTPLEQPAPQATVTTGANSSGISYWLKKPVVIALLAVAAAVVIGGGFVFGFYLPNTPDGMFDASLNNTAKGIDALLDYGKAQDVAGYTGASYDGTFTLKSASGSMDASLLGASDAKGNANLAVTANVMGHKGSANVRTLRVAGTVSPDVYVQVNGISPLLQSMGMDSLAKLDGQWIAIDHTLIDTYVARASASKGQTASGGALAAPTYAQLDDAFRRVQAVNKDYLFTTNSGKAVLKQQKFVGTEQVNGRTMNHYSVGYDKTHLTAYIDALRAALDGSKLNDWSKKASGDNLSTSMNLDGLKTDIKNARSDYTFDLWTDNQTRAVSQVSFKDATDASSVFTVSQAHTSGSQYPFALTIKSKNASDGAQDGTFGLTLDTSTHKIAFTTKMTSNSGEGDTTFDVTMNVLPSNKKIDVTVPTGAKPITDILNSLGLGGLTNAAPASNLMTRPLDTSSIGTRT